MSAWAPALPHLRCRLLTADDVCWLQYIRRKRTAEAMRSAYEERLQAAADGTADGHAGAAEAAPLAGAA